MEVIYSINAITTKQKNKIKTFLMPFLIMYRLKFVGQRALTLARNIAYGPLVNIIYVVYGTK